MYPQQGTIKHTHVDRVMKDEEWGGRKNRKIIIGQGHFEYRTEHTSFSIYPVLSHKLQ